MAIEGIKPSVMNQVNRVTEPVTRENGETVQLRPQQTAPVTGRRSEYEQKNEQGKEKEQGKDEGQDLKNVSPEKLKTAIDDINKKIRLTHTQCEFKFHDKTNRISITVKDSETQEVIREIPPEKMLDMVAKTLELAGLLIDEKR